MKIYHFSSVYTRLEVFQHDFLKEDEGHTGASEYLVEKTANTRRGAPENIPPS